MKHFITNFLTERVSNRPEHRLLTDLIKHSSDSSGELRQLTKQLRDREIALELATKKYQYLCELTQAVLDAMPGIVWGKDLAGKFILTNKKLRDTLMGGCTIEEALTHTAESIAEKLGRGDTLHLDCARTDAYILETGEAEHFIERGMVSGKYTIVRTSKAPLRDLQGNIIGTVGFGRDITKNCKMAFDILEEVEKASETCPQECDYCNAVAERLNSVIGTLHTALANMCDSNPMITKQDFDESATEERSDDGQG